MIFWIITEDDCHEDFHMLEMDMESKYLGITAENVEDLIKPELKEQFQ